jgi:hypothetical protein
MDYMQRILSAHRSLTIGPNPKPEKLIAYHRCFRLSEINAVLLYLDWEITQALGEEAMDQWRLDDIRDFINDRQEGLGEIVPDSYLSGIGLIDDEEFERRSERQADMMTDPATYLPLFLEEGFTRQDVVKLATKMKLASVPEETIKEILGAALAVLKDRTRETPHVGA